MITIKELEKQEFPGFMEYMSSHVQENAQAGINLFLPLSATQSVISPEMREKFETGIEKNIGEAGWRKTWIARTPDAKIAGHIDIRPHSNLNADHRVLLGMGVDRNFRKMRVGEKLMTHMIDYCRQNPAISWVDLQVMTNNTPALNLYRKLNFQDQGTTEDMFRINGVSYNYTAMTLRVEQ